VGEDPSTPEYAPRVNILGVGVSTINLDMAVGIIDGWIAERTSRYVTVTGVHGIMESQRDPVMRKIHNQAGLVTPDGMPLVWLSRLHGHAQVDRVYGPDLMLALGQHSLARGYRHFFYGGTPETAELLGQKLSAKLPGLQVAGFYAPPYRPLTAEEDQAAVDLINQSQADIVWVGLGTPKQELWMAEHLGRINAPVLIGVGAAFDFHAGKKKQAPRWIQRSGLEWVFRLLTEPRRLWKRYLVNNPSFLALVLAQALRIKRYKEDWKSRD
jgi:N-acetylglucosaminyldiphosphoundecaprenol N-acetyl-beta-D-mannosaminyltransferase